MPRYVFALSTLALEDALQALLAERFDSVRHDPRLRFEIWTAGPLTKLELCQVVTEIQRFLRESFGIPDLQPSATAREAKRAPAHWLLEETEQIPEGASPWSKTTPPPHVV